MVLPVLVAVPAHAPVSPALTPALSPAAWPALSPALWPDALPATGWAPRPAPQAGLTLLEVLIALAVAAGLLFAAAGSLGTWIPRAQQRNQADALVQALHHARSEAIKRGHRVDLCPSADGATCDAAGRWELGWLLFDDPDHDGDRATGEAIVRVEARAGNGITVRGNRPVAGYVSFTAQGLARLASGALQMGTFTVCKPGLDTLEVVLANGGRPRLQEVPVRCP
jgi:type IV fimbrial biogenesis protein FimT